jgi:hypothetical protein
MRVAAGLYSDSDSKRIRLGTESEESADLIDPQLPADFAGQSVVDLRVSWHGGLRAIGRIHIDRMPRPLAFQTAALPLQVANQFVAFHMRRAPTCTESGTNSIKSASSAEASAEGIGRGFPSFNRS